MVTAKIYSVLFRSLFCAKLLTSHYVKGRDEFERSVLFRRISSLAAPGGYESAAQKG